MVIKNAIEKIAFEKAGIIKKKSTVVLSKQSKIVRNIVKKEVVKKNFKPCGNIDGLSAKGKTLRFS